MGKSWTLEEEQIFKTNYGKIPISELAKMLNRSEQALYSFARTRTQAKRQKPQKSPKEKKPNTIEELAKALEAAINKEEKELNERLSYLQSFKRV